MTDVVKIVNTVTNKEVTIATRNSKYVLESVDWGVVKSKHQSYKYLNQVGVHVTGTTLETRQVSIVGWIVGDTYQDILNRKAVFNLMINPKQPLDIFNGDYKLTMYADSSIKYSVSYNENNEYMCKFLISGMCADPLFTSKDEFRVDGASTIPMFHFPLIIPKDKGIIMGYRQPSLIVAVENKGAVPIGMRVEFAAKGTVTNPKLIDANTQEFFAINKTMESGERIIFDTKDGSKKVIGHYRNKTYNYYQYRDLDSTWLKLELGTNLFRYDADSNIDALEVFIYFGDKYMEVY